MNVFSKLTGLLVILIFAAKAQAQQSVNTAGANISSASGSVSYSAGQVVFHTVSGINGSVAEGIQQPYEISVVTATETGNEIAWNMIVYPNPTSGNLKLNISGPDVSEMKYLLYNLQGQLIREEAISTNDTEIPMGDFSPSTYFINIKQSANTLKTFRIIKK